MLLPLKVVPKHSTITTPLPSGGIRRPSCIIPVVVEGPSQAQTLELEPLDEAVFEFRAGGRKPSKSFSFAEDDRNRSDAARLGWLMSSILDGVQSAQRSAAMGSSRQNR